MKHDEQHDKFEILRPHFVDVSNRSCNLLGTMTYPIKRQLCVDDFPLPVVGYDGLVPWRVLRLKLVNFLKCWTHSSTFIVLRVFVQLTWDRDVQGMPHFRKQPSSLAACNLWYPWKGCNISIASNLQWCCFSLQLLCLFFLYSHSVFGIVGKCEACFHVSTCKYIYTIPRLPIYGDPSPNHSPDSEVKPPSWIYPMKSQVVGPKVPSYLQPRRIGRKADRNDVCQNPVPTTPVLQKNRVSLISIHFGMFQENDGISSQVDFLRSVWLLISNVMKKTLKDQPLNIKFDVWSVIDDQSI